METFDYAVHDGETLGLDLYRPAGPGPHPVVVMIHGGWWQTGTRAQYELWGAFLASRGFAAASIDYRLSTSTQATWREAFWDCTAAVRFVRGESTALGIDPRRIALMGGSAGAHLVALVALAHDDPSLASPYRDDHVATDGGVQAVIPVYGPFELVKAWTYLETTVQRDGNPVARLVGGAPSAYPERYRLASPIEHVGPSAAHMRWLVISGTADRVCLPEWSDELSAALLRVGADVEPLALEGAPHGFLSKGAVLEPGSWNERVAPRVLAFLSRALGAAA